MKVITAKEMSRIEKLAIEDGASDSDFMDTAGAGIAEIIDFDIKQQNYKKELTLLCGKGNNAGDAYVVGNILLSRGYTVTALHLAPLVTSSPLCQKHQKIFLEKGGLFIQVNNESDLTMPKDGVFIDGMFGTGFKGEVKGTFAAAMAIANDSKLPTYAIDIPSGINGDNGETGGITINATKTIFLGLPKTGFFLNDGWRYVGKLHGVDFGLEQKYIEKAKEDFFLLNKREVQNYLPKIIRNRHKYQAGYVVALAGSPGMPGAAILSTFASMRSGAGIVRLFHPEGMEAELSNSPSEIIKEAYNKDSYEQILATLNTSTASLIGPGLGRSELSKELIESILPKLIKPCVLDADALNILSESNIELPGNIIMTPHIGEMHRLLHLKEKMPLDHRFLDLCSHYAKENKVTLVLKGSPTFIFQSDKEPLINPYGDPGMATAGSGDVLSGIIAGLLSQGMILHQAACLGTYLHSMSGEFAAKELSSSCVVAHDLIDYLPQVFKSLNSCS
jgi:hydroxyethylthiazole kinase-like uncharacterized protein yjeF